MSRSSLPRWARTVALALAAILAQPVLASASAAADEVHDRLGAVPGMRFIGESTNEVPAGYRYFTYVYRQPVDHRNPGGASFEQRIRFMHRGFDRPVIGETEGYVLWPKPYRLDLTRTVDGNQITIEHRYFASSKPAGPLDWSKLDIWQAATDHHRVIQALRKVYGRKWITTGGSKSGMASVYHRRFYPDDVDATVPYVAPSDANEADDTGQVTHFDTVGSEECRTRVRAFQRRALTLRDEVVPRLQKDADAKGQTYRIFGGVDRSYEYAVSHLPWGLWQSGDSEANCRLIGPADASADQVYEWAVKDGITLAVHDKYLVEGGYLPFRYQAATQLGSATLPTWYLKDLLRHIPSQARDFVPRDIPVTFDTKAMSDVHEWVLRHADRMLFVYGANDPWSGEKFELGEHVKDSYVVTVAGQNHGAEIYHLPKEEADRYNALIRSWAGVGAEARTAGTRFVPGLDDVRPHRMPGLFG